MPYPLLVGPLSGFMSLVPYVGLPLAMIPPLFAALPLNAVPVYVLVVVTVAMLHLVALNLLYPKIVGSRVHLNPLVVTFSLMLWGFLWDAPGLLLAIPLTAGHQGGLRQRQGAAAHRQSSWATEGLSRWIKRWEVPRVRPGPSQPGSPG